MIAALCLAPGSLPVAAQMRAQAGDVVALPVASAIGGGILSSAVPLPKSLAPAGLGVPLAAPSVVPTRSSRLIPADAVVDGSEIFDQAVVELNALFGEDGLRNSQTAVGLAAGPNARPITSSEVERMRRYFLSARARPRKSKTKAGAAVESAISSIS